MLSSGVRRIWKCMSITGELQRGASCACDGDASAIAPKDVRSVRLSISCLRFLLEANPLPFAPGKPVLSQMLQRIPAFAAAIRVQRNVQFTLGAGSDIRDVGLDSRPRQKIVSPQGDGL